MRKSCESPQVPEIKCVLEVIMSYDLSQDDTVESSQFYQNRKYITKYTDNKFQKGEEVSSEGDSSQLRRTFGL